MMYFFHDPQKLIFPIFPMTRQLCREVQNQKSRVLSTGILKNPGHFVSSQQSNCTREVGELKDSFPNGFQTSLHTTLECKSLSAIFEIIERRNQRSLCNDCHFGSLHINFLGKFSLVVEVNADTVFSKDLSREHLTDANITITTKNRSNPRGEKFKQSIYLVANCILRPLLSDNAKRLSSVNLFAKFHFSNSG